MNIILQIIILGANMSVCLNVEDGTGLDDSNSYLSIEDARKTLFQLGYDFGDSTETEIAQYLIRSAMYLNSFEAQYKGYKKSCQQGLSWPRNSVLVNCCHIPSDEIPKSLKRAQALGAFYESSGQCLQSVSNGKEIASEEIVGAVKVSYFETGSTEGSTIFQPINNLLSELMDSSSGSLSVVRS